MTTCSPVRVLLARVMIQRLPTQTAAPNELHFVRDGEDDIGYLLRDGRTVETVVEYRIVIATLPTLL